MELHVYDFDGTLFHSPTPPASYRDTGGWWSDSLSLSEPCVPDKPSGAWWIEQVASAAKASISDPDVLAILCTGRSVQSFARFRVPELLRQKGLHFDEVHLKPSTTTATEAFKKGVLLSAIARYPDIEAVHIYEDRANHLSSFCQVVEGAGVACVPHLIRGVGPVCDAAAVERVAARWVARTS